MRPAKIVAIVFGVLLILIGLALLAPGSFLLWLDGAGDSQGYINTRTHSLESIGYALVTPDVKVALGSSNWIPGDWAFQIRASSRGDAPLFVGVGPSADVADYLNGVAYDEVTNIGWFASGGSDYRSSEGSASPATPPGQQTFWAAKQEGPGTQKLQWPIQGGDWTAVLMNADGSPTVSADVSLGAHLGFLLPLGIGLTVGAVVLLVVGILLLVLGVRRPRKPALSAPGYPAGQQPYGQGQYAQPAQYAPYMPPPAGQAPVQPVPSQPAPTEPPGSGPAPSGAAPPQE
jgi:hypothetical protein